MGKKLRIILDDALAFLDRLPASPLTETVPVAEAAGRVLAEEVRAAEPVPPFAKSPLDGYAFRTADLAGAAPEHPVTLRVVEEIPAGGVPSRGLEPGEAAKVLTGAPLPAGADGVERYEMTEFTPETVTLSDPMAPGTNVVPVGDDVEEGQVLAGPGTLISPPLAGLLAATGVASVPVCRRPVVTLVNTGDEILPPESPLQPGKIRNSSRYSLGGYLEQAGALVRDGGIVPDRAEPIAEALAAALKCSDMAITTGGVSVGDYDMVRAACALLGAKELFWKVRMKPGGTLLCAEKDGKLILGLSGNPASAALGLHLLGLPFVKKLAGRGLVRPQKIRVTLLGPIAKDSPNGRLIRGSLEIVDGIASFRPIDVQGNGALTSLLGCDLIGTLPPETPPLPTGAVIDAWWTGRNECC